MGIHHYDCFVVFWWLFFVNCQNVCYWIAFWFVFKQFKVLSYHLLNYLWHFWNSNGLYWYQMPILMHLYNLFGKNISFRWNPTFLSKSAPCVFDACAFALRRTPRALGTFAFKTKSSDGINAIMNRLWRPKKLGLVYQIKLLKQGQSSFHAVSCLVKSKFFCNAVSCLFAFLTRWDPLEGLV